MRTRYTPLCTSRFCAATAGADPQKFFNTTITAMKGAKSPASFTIPDCINQVIKNVEVKGKLTAKREAFSTEEKEVIAQIFGVIQKFVSIPEGSPVFGTTSGQYAEAWNRAKQQNAHNGEIYPLFPTFLFNVLYVKPDDPTNNILTCAAAMLLELACAIEDFGDYVRKMRAEPFGCCLVTDNTDQLKTLSEKFVKDGSPEITAISKWVNGSLDGVDKSRVHYTLSVGGESGSGKTHAALQCVNFLNVENKDPLDYLVVYIKLCSTDNSQAVGAAVKWYCEFRPEHKRLAKAVGKRLKDAMSVDKLMARVPKYSVLRSILRALRAYLWYDVIQSRIRAIVHHDGDLRAERQFKRVFFVLDEVAACPWIYRSVNRAATGKISVQKLFSERTNFGENFQIICCSTVNKTAFQDMLSTPSFFFPVIMLSCSTVYEKLAGDRENLNSRKGLMERVVSNSFYAQLVENRRCGAMTVEAVDDSVGTSTLKGTLVGVDSLPLPKGLKPLFSDVDEEGIYSFAGFIAGRVAAQYKESNGARDISPRSGAEGRCEIDP
ncbi:hypothetical protein AGDE_15068 [Angomonas deanei]|uniref:Uncharacterized protein n=1 Tax=Angomonas deanei TaxID=59799 RepID=A0A7G2CNR7_9TRYP|nr:hypothetical protein AGDE_15068 [Angomonas deanei]CAD2221125.1 hypothetical protein, conserved [Angomonas deanei]|eukprot:EPY19735.1 hypothetical protein AGDE_15068 [Angomonas deanei]